MATAAIMIPATLITIIIAGAISDFICNYFL